LTHTGLLMEGVARLWDRQALRGNGLPNFAISSPFLAKRKTLIEKGLEGNCLKIKL